MSDSPAGDRWALPGSIAEPDADDMAPPAPSSAPAGGGAPSGLRSRRTGSFGATGLVVQEEDESGRSRGAPRLALRPLTVADILDGAFGIVKARPARILGLAAVFVVPAALLVAYLQRDATTLSGEWWEGWAADEDVVDEGPSGWAMLMDWTLSGLALVFVAAALGYLLGAWSSGRDPGMGELLAVIGRRSWALVASFVLVHLLEGVGLLACLVGAVFVMPFFVSVAPAIGAEGAGPLRAMRRSAGLARARYWPTLGISLLIGLVATLLGVALGGAPAVLGALLGFEAAWPLVALAGMAGGVVVTPFVAGATVLLYLDLRMRTEGLDLELIARDVFDGSVA